MEAIAERNFDRLRILFLSNLILEKGILDLLEALKILKSAGVTFSANIAGDMDESLRERFEAYMKELEGFVEYAGVVSGHEKRDLFAGANVFVLPTYYSVEGQPISVLEAMATGNIIVTTEHGGMPDIVENGRNGFFVEKRDPESIADRLRSIADDLQCLKHMALDNHREAKEKYRISRFVGELHSILEQVAMSRGGI